MSPFPTSSSSRFLDLKAVAAPILRHRIIPNHLAVGDGVTAGDIVNHLLV